MIPYRPQGDRLVVRPDPIPDRVGSIIIPESAKAGLRKETWTGVVMAMGPGMLRADGRRWPMPDVKLGDRVVYFKDGEQRIQVGEETFVSLRDEFVFGEVLP